MLLTGKCMVKSVLQKWLDIIWYTIIVLIQITKQSNHMTWSISWEYFQGIFGWAVMVKDMLLLKTNLYLRVITDITIFLYCQLCIYFVTVITVHTSLYSQKIFSKPAWLRNIYRCSLFLTYQYVHRQSAEALTRLWRRPKHTEKGWPVDAPDSVGVCHTDY